MEEGKKKNILKITLYTLGLILVLAVGSLAVYNASIPGTALNKLIVSQPDFKFNFTESNTVSLENPTSDELKNFNFNVTTSSSEANYTFNINYTIYLKVTSSTISDYANLVYVSLYDNNGNVLVSPTKLGSLTKVSGKSDEYILKTNTVQIKNNSQIDNYVLKYSYLNDAQVEYTTDDTSQTGTYKVTEGTFVMTVNTSLNSFTYTKS